MKENLTTVIRQNRKALRCTGINYEKSQKGKTERKNKIIILKNFFFLEHKCVKKINEENIASNQSVLSRSAEDYKQDENGKGTKNGIIKYSTNNILKGNYMLKISNNTDVRISNINETLTEFIISKHVPVWFFDSRMEIFEGLNMLSTLAKETYV